MLRSELIIYLCSNSDKSLKKVENLKNKIDEKR